MWTIFSKVKMQWQIWGQQPQSRGTTLNQEAPPACYKIGPLIWAFGAVADLRGSRGTLTPSLWAINVFIFMLFSGKIGEIVCWRPPPPPPTLAPPPLGNPGSATVVVQTKLLRQRIWIWNHNYISIQTNNVFAIHVVNWFIFLCQLNLTPMTYGFYM